MGERLYCAVAMLA